ncbi:hypothetical protein TALC_00796 [Thermoplasmatales archaeon BRNA1]|nr:hypothetical protein TALC_00796 [Thermoplasmatales archaeon BRNA1]
MSKCPVEGGGLRASKRFSSEVCLAAALMVMVLVVSCFVLFSDSDDSSADPPATSGSCGTSATWSYADGTLTISGTGTMSDYENARDAPWYPLNKDITTIVIQSGITSIGKFAFFDLPNLTSVTIPEGVTLIGYESFYGCRSLSALTLPDSLETIKNYAFQNCTSLTGISIPDGVTTLESGVFTGCSSLQSIDLGSIEDLNGNALDGCNSLTSITIPATVTNIYSADYGCFGRTPSLTSITVEAGSTKFKDVDGVLYDNTEKYLRCYPAGRTATTYSVPAGTVDIRHAAFSNCPSLQTVTFPDTLKVIYNNAFRNCPSLTSVSIPAGITTINDNSFRECTSLESFSAPSSVTHIGDYAFFGCTSLAEVQIHGVIGAEGQGTFKGCTSLTSITVDADPGASENYWYTEDGALFRYYYGERTLICYPAGNTAAAYSIPEGITAVGDGAISFNAHLRSLSIPDSVTSINGGAFDGTDGLGSVTVSANNGSFASEGGVLYNKSKTQIVLYPPARTDSSFTIPDGVATVSGQLSSIHLTSITVPDSFENPSFFDCPNLVSVNGNTTNPTYSFADGCVYLKGTGNIYHIPLGVTSYTVPSTVTEFDEGTIIGSNMSEVKFVSGTALNVPMTGLFLTRSDLTLIIEEGASITFGQYAIVFESSDSPLTGATLTAVVPKGFTFPEDSVVYIGAGETIAQATIKYVDSSLDPSGGKIAVESDTGSEELDTDSIAFIKGQAEKNPGLVMNISLAGGITASFDNKAIKSLGSSSATLSVNKVAAENLDQATKDLVGDNPVFEISFGANTNFGEGKATFTVPYTLPEGKSAEDLKVYYIKDGAVAETINCTYADGKVTFSTGHLSTYSVGFIDTSGGDSGSGAGSEFPIWIVAVIAIAVAVAAVGTFFFLRRRV